MMSTMAKRKTFESTPEGFAKLLYHSAKLDVMNEEFVKHMTDNLSLAAGNFTKTFAFAMFYGSIKLSLDKSIIYFAQHEFNSWVDPDVNETNPHIPEIFANLGTKDKQQKYRAETVQILELLEALNANKNLSRAEKLDIYHSFISPFIEGAFGELRYFPKFIVRLAYAYMTPMFCRMPEADMVIAEFARHRGISNMYLLADMHNLLLKLRPVAEQKEKEITDISSIERYNDDEREVKTEEMELLVLNKFKDQENSLEEIDEEEVDIELLKASRLSERIVDLAVDDMLRFKTTEVPPFGNLIDMIVDKIKRKKEMAWRYNVEEARFYTYEELKSRREDTDISHYKFFPSLELPPEDLEEMKKMLDYNEMAKSINWDEMDFSYSIKNEDGTMSVQHDDENYVDEEQDFKDHELGFEREDKVLLDRLARLKEKGEDGEVFEEEEEDYEEEDDDDEFDIGTTAL